MPHLHRVVSLAALALVASHCKRGPSDADRASHAATPSASVATGAAPNGSVAPGTAPSTAASAGAPRTKVTAEAGAMGTRVNFVALTSDRIDEAHVHEAIELAIEEIRRLESLMTTWKDDSEVSQINQSAGKAPVRVGPETLDVIAKSLWISERSGGVFDITFEVMHGLWRFDEDLEKRLPDGKDIAERRKLIDYRHIILDRDKSTVFLNQASTKISLGGIAKGYAIDKAAQVLLAAGIEDFLAQAGGDLYVHGHRADGSPWMAGVRDPRGVEGSYFARMPVVNHAFSTAGDYERSYILDGKRYHHIIDPRTGYPATASRSVTIWAKDALTADALDDAVFILGPEKGLSLVDSIEDAGAIIVDADNRVHVSKRIEDKVVFESQPTGGI